MHREGDGSNRDRLRAILGVGVEARRDQGGIGVARVDAWTGRELAALFAILLLALVLRGHDMTAVPPLADNQDELAWAWSGLTVLTDGEPASWSYLPAYSDRTVLRANGTSYPIVRPYLDHPPLFSIMVGGWAWLQGARAITDVSPEMIRPVAIALSLLSLSLAYALGRRLIGRGPALVGTALLATSPVAVLLSRVVEAEALLAPLFLAAMILLHQVWSSDETPWTAIGLLACCAAAPLAKVPGAAVPAAATVALLMIRRERLAVAAAAAGLIGLGLYAVYGAFHDWTVFLRVIDAQADRRSGVMGAVEFVTAPAGIGQPLRDGWWILGWLGIVLLLAARATSPRVVLLALPVLVFTGAMMVLGDERVIARFGWYRFAVYPLVYLGAGFLVWRAVTTASVPLLLAVLVTGGATATTALFTVNGQAWTPSALVVAFLLALVLVPAVAGTWYGSPRSRLGLAARGVAATAVALLLVANALEAWRLSTIYRLL